MRVSSEELGHSEQRGDGVVVIRFDAVVWRSEWRAEDEGFRTGSSKGAQNAVGVFAW